MKKLRTAKMTRLEQKQQTKDGNLHSKFKAECRTKWLWLKLRKTSPVIVRFSDISGSRLNLLFKCRLFKKRFYLR